jgi:hypothetical protein
MSAALLSAKEAAALLRVHVNTLKNWRDRGVGPRALRVGRCIKYRSTDLALFLERASVPAVQNPLSRGAR